MRAERRDIRELLEQLTDDQWDAPSLCGDWTVRELVVHLVAWDDLLLYRTGREHAAALLRFSSLYARSLASMDRLNRRLQALVLERDREALMRRFGAEDDGELRWLFERSNPAGHLAEYVIHHQDIRRPLRMPRTVPAARLLGALDGATKLPGVRIRAWRVLRRRTLQATDVDWRRGRGPVEERHGEEILMILAGRRVSPIKTTRPS